MSLLKPRFNLCDLQKLNYRRKIFWNEKRKCSHTVQIIALAPLTPPFHLCDLQKSSYRKKIIGAKTENASTLLRAQGWNRWHFTFTCTRYQKINVLAEKGICLHTFQGTELSLLTPRFNLCDLQKLNYRRKIFWNEKQKCLHTVQIIALAPLTPPFHLCDLQKSRYRKKNIGAKNENARTLLRVPDWYRWHLTFTCARYQKINVLTEKRICLHSVQGTELLLLTPRFNLCDLQKLNYRRKSFWTEKRKCSHTVQAIALEPLTTPFHVCDLLKTRYLRMIYCSEKLKCSKIAQGIALVPLTLSSVRDSKKKIFWPKKRKCSHTVQGTELAPLTPFHLCDLQKSRYQSKFFWIEKRNCWHTAQRTALVQLTPPFHLFEIFKKRFLDRKAKMLAYCHVTALAP